MTDPTQENDDVSRLAALLAAEKRADAMLDAIERAGFIAAGRTEREVEQDIYALAARDFGVEAHWHKRIVRSGPNGLSIFSDNPPIRQIEADDMVFLDLGPVFERWEADVGRTYVIGDDPRKHQLCADLESIFDALRRHFDGHADITGAELYAEAQRLAEQAGWRFGGQAEGIRCRTRVRNYPEPRGYRARTRALYSSSSR
jgi:Xaa-Pro dipeptidase